ncbi:MAG: Unknown protein [uncultured Sulfurovum sp.]|uniref:Pyridoxamine 5'-phosphate oxidase N-terminal domain-containing protein n=1 Tax=uncultured Sulfurovum sp. TaxID=269237 RepID=A0A6S6SYL1_9BACT|nr:MAG: Unknown protein [uncultured Sulfurovum sp.]
MQKLSELLSNSQSVALNTKDENGHPFSSYTSFYYDGEIIYVSLPSIVTHVGNLEYNPQALALFVEDASSNKRVLERCKTTLECEVRRIFSEDSKFNEIMPKFEEGAFGILLGTQELILYALTPSAGEVTFGLGDTYEVGGDKMNELVWEKKDK